MRTSAWIFIVLLGFVGNARAQPPALARWEVSGSVGLFSASPGETDARYGDDWYSEGRYAFAIGHYWSEQLKTEVEYATSGEGSMYRFTDQSSSDSLHRLEQLSARMVWQFGKNRWVQPYVSGGITGDRDRHRTRMQEQFRYPPGRTSGPMIRIPESTSDTAFDYRVGFTAGAGTKFYMSQDAFFSAGVISTYSKPAATFSLIAGFGIDF